MDKIKTLFYETLSKVKAIAAAAAIAGVVGFTEYLVGLDTAATFGVTGGLIAATVIGYFKREGSTRIIEYLEKHAKDDGDVVPV